MKPFGLLATFVALALCPGAISQRSEQQHLWASDYAKQIGAHYDGSRNELVGGISLFLPFFCVEDHYPNVVGYVILDVDLNTGATRILDKKLPEDGFHCTTGKP